MSDTNNFIPLFVVKIVELSGLSEKLRNGLKDGDLLHKKFNNQSVIEDRS